MCPDTWAHRGPSYAPSFALWHAWCLFALACMDNFFMKTLFDNSHACTCVAPMAPHTAQDKGAVKQA